MSSGPELSILERASIRIGAFANRGSLSKRAQRFYHYYVSRSWVMEAVGRRVYVDGIDRVLNLNPDRGVMMAANHRSFYDQWINVLGLFEKGGADFWGRNLYFPVRSNFFYDSPAGMLVNTMIGAWTMFPPIFRQLEKSVLNRDALDKITAFLADPHTIVGVHPEGTRGKGPDPYEILSAQPGIGRMILQAKPIVIPFFINGVGNSPTEVLKTTQTRGARRTHPIIVVYGEPIDYSDLADKTPRPVLYLKASKRVRKAIIKLIPREQELRQMAADGKLPDSAPGWLRPPLPWTR